MDFEHEIRELKRRVGDLEGAVSVLTGDLRTLGPRLDSFQDTEETRFNTLSRSIDGVLKRLDSMNTQIWSLRDDLPDLVRTAIGRGSGQTLS